MNQRGILADSWRQIKLAADDLKSILNLSATQTVRTRDNVNRAFDFTLDESTTNLALSLSQLGTKYLNQIFTVTREVKDAATGAVMVEADYSELGVLLISVTLIGLVLPIGAILLVRLTHFRTG